MASVWAQQPASGAKTSAFTGSVVGYVHYDETQLPVRFAEILLIPKIADADIIRVEDQAIPSNPPIPHLVRVIGAAGMDGSFRMDGVPVGDYFAGARMPGYVTLRKGTEASATGEELKHLVASLPTIHVGEGQVASVNLVLHRGGVISGRVQFADGSPAVGVEVAWEFAEMDPAIEAVRLARPSPQQEIMQEFEWYTDHRRTVATDEEGRYRIFGLVPGNYIVNTVVASQLGSSAGVMLSDGSGSDSRGRVHPYPEMTTIYGPGTVRRKDAKIFEIRGEEQVNNADLRIDPSGLHTIRGKVLARDDRHVPIQAIIRLLEGGKDTGRFLMNEDDGSFQIDYVPQGSYTLEVEGAEEMTNQTSPTDSARASRFYKGSKLAVLVGEHDVVLDELLLTAVPVEMMQR